MSWEKRRLPRDDPRRCRRCGTQPATVRLSAERKWDELSAEIRAAERWRRWQGLPLCARCAELAIAKAAVALARGVSR